MKFRPPKFPIVEPPFELKGSLFTLTVMYLCRADLGVIRHHLTQKVKQAPGFFNNLPVVIDLDTLKEKERVIDFAGLYDLLRQQGMIPVGVRHGSAELQAAAVRAGLPILPEARSSGIGKKPDKPEATVTGFRSKLIIQPVRSGQQIYAYEGDLIILGTVSAGAEVLADGHIHVYGSLRGRALAGIKGDLEARIFCHSLEAELVSIAGHYRVIEQLDEEECGKAVQIYLVKDRLVTKPLFG
jgi:septum site-determining protein MinC